MVAGRDWNSKKSGSQFKAVKHDLSHDELAEILGVDRDAIERGEYELNIGSAEDLHCILEMKAVAWHIRESIDKINSLLGMRFVKAMAIDKTVTGDEEGDYVKVPAKGINDIMGVMMHMKMGADLIMNIGMVDSFEECYAAAMTIGGGIKEIYDEIKEIKNKTEKGENDGE